MKPGKAIGLAFIVCYALLTACTGTYAESAEAADPSVLQRWGVTLDWIELELDEGVR